jgi:hypothetical protein
VLLLLLLPPPHAAAAAAGTAGGRVVKQLRRQCGARFTASQSACQDNFSKLAAVAVAAKHVGTKDKLHLLHNHTAAASFTHTPHS